jgi:GNAT superfamily N-acetyltransferase
MSLVSLKGVGRALQNFRRDAAIMWRYGGLPAIWEALLQRTAYRLYRRQSGVLFEEDLTMVSEWPTPAGVEIRVLADRDWGALAQALTTRSLERFRRRAMPGRTCLVAWGGGRPVGYTWLSEPEATPESLPVSLPSGVVYGWGLWVDPGERGRGVGSALVSTRLVYAREHGARRAWRVIGDDNRPALRTFQKTSDDRARPLGRVTYVTFLGRLRGRYEPWSAPVP